MESVSLWNTLCAAFLEATQPHPWGESPCEGWASFQTSPPKSFRDLWPESEGTSRRETETFFAVLCLFPPESGKGRPLCYSACECRPRYSLSHHRLCCAPRVHTRPGSLTRAKKGACGAGTGGCRALCGVFARSLSHPIALTIIRRGHDTGTLFLGEGLGTRGVDDSPQLEAARPGFSQPGVIQSVL